VWHFSTEACEVAAAIIVTLYWAVGGIAQPDYGFCFCGRGAINLDAAAI